MDVDDTSDELILENQAKALAYIRLYLGDGPLLQTRQVINPRELWKKLKTLYEPKGFSSNFLLCKDLFDTTLAKCGGSIEKYLNKIIKLNDDLAAHSIIIPNKVITAWALNHLTLEYEQTVAIISQTFRACEGEINTEELFSQLLDESRRLKSKERKETA
jgi:gag-polypeptide of LTR copia-type